MSVSLLSPLSAVPIVFLDVETTGASPDYGDRVIELGMARYEGGQLVATFQELVDPMRPVGPGITALTGISNEMLEGRPLFKEIAGRALDLCRGAVLAGHNVPFDLGFLRSEFRKAGLDLAKELPGAHVLDTVRIARNRFGRGGNSLQALATKFAVREETAHRALADALTTARVFEKLMEPVGGWQTPLIDTLKAQGGVVRLEGTPKKDALPLEIEEALNSGAEGRSVELTYIDAREQKTTRVVIPVEVRKFKGEMILVAWCDMRKDRRHFKLARIVTVTRIDTDSQVAPEVGPVTKQPRAALPPIIKAAAMTFPGKSEGPARADDAAAGGLFPGD